MGYLQRDHGGAWWFKYSGKEGIRGKCMPWGTVWSWRFPLYRGGCEGKRIMGKDGPSWVIFHRVTTQVWCCQVVQFWVFPCELRLVSWEAAHHCHWYTFMSLWSVKWRAACHWQITVKRQELKWEKGVSSPLHGTHMDTAVLWHEGYPITLGCYSHLKSCLDWERCHKSQSCSWSPLYCRSRLYPKAILSGTTDPWVKSTYFSLTQQSCDRCITSPYTNLCANLWDFCPDYSWGNNSDTPQTLSCRLSIKDFHFLSKGFKRTSDGLQTCPLFYDLCK